MRLEEIGFYSLSDTRAKNITWDSDLKRCELLLTDECNFRCPYCRGLKKELKGNLSFQEAKKIVDLWCDEGSLENIRFSGGEPTLWPDLKKLIEYTYTKESIKRIALSTNGSASLDFYIRLLLAGVNDFSISLDACCSSEMKKMTGGYNNFKHIEEVIKELSKITYVSAGIVITKENINEIQYIISYLFSLKVSDIRIISSAQFNREMENNIDCLIHNNYKILKYRLNNISNGRSMRGLAPNDSNKCHLIKDDMVIVGNYHFPCVIYMREKGNAIGTIDNKSLIEIRKERKEWFEKTNIKKDNICLKNCLDVCIDFNNRV